MKCDERNARFYKIFEARCKESELNPTGNERVAAWHAVFELVHEVAPKSGFLNNHSKGIEAVLETVRLLADKAEAYDKIIEQGPEAYYDRQSREPTLCWAFDGYKPSDSDVVLFEVKNPKAFHPNLPAKGIDEDFTDEDSQ